MPMKYSGDNLTFPDNSIQSTAATGFGFKNRIINGDCRVAQRPALSITGNSTPSIYGGCDRITGLTYGFSTATGTLQQSGSGFGVAGLSQAIVGLTTTGSGGVTFGQRIESSNIKDCNGSTVTVQAKVYQNTGSNQSLYLRLNKANSVDNFSAVTILSTSSVFTIPSGSLTTVSATFTLGVTDASNGILVEAFYAGLGSFTSKDFHITDFQLEKGSTATSFDYRPYGTELALCQRYCYQITGSAASQAPLGSAFAISATSAECFVAFPVTMRASPTFAYSAAADITFTWSAGTSTTSALNLDLYSPYSALVRINTTGLSVGQGGYYRVEAAASKYIRFEAEL